MINLVFIGAFIISQPGAGYNNKKIKYGEYREKCIKSYN